MVNYKLQYGSLDLTSVGGMTCRLSSKSLTADSGARELPRLSGAVIQPLRFQPRKLVITADVTLTAGSFTNLLAAVDTLLSALASQGSGLPNELFFGRADRYIYAQVVSGAEKFDQGGMSWFGADHEFDIEFLAADPFFYDTAGTQTVNLTNTGGTVTPSNGSVNTNAPTFATWQFTIATGGAGTVTITNAATGEAAVISSANLSGGVFVTGDVIQLVRNFQAGASSYVVNYNSVATPGLMSGIIPMLVAGSNAVTIGVTGACTVSNVSGHVPTASYLPRWW